MGWNEELDLASFRGEVFHTQQVKDEEMRRWAIYKYPFRNGANVQDMGGEPHITKLSAVFLGESSLADFGAFRLIVRQGKAGTFTHPLFGVWKARVRIPDITAKHDFRDGFQVEIEVIEDGVNTDLPDVFSVTKLAADVKTKTAALAAELALIPDTTTAWTNAAAEVQSAITEAESFAGQAESHAAAVEEANNAVRTQVQLAVGKVREGISESARVYGVVKELHMVGHACSALACRVLSDKPPLRTYTTPVEMPTVLLAHKLYGDASRVDEIESMNIIRNPAAVPAGTQLKVFSW